MGVFRECRLSHCWDPGAASTGRGRKPGPWSWGPTCFRFGFWALPSGSLETVASFSHWLCEPQQPAGVWPPVDISLVKMCALLGHTVLSSENKVCLSRPEGARISQAFSECTRHTDCIHSLVDTSLLSR